MKNLGVRLREGINVHANYRTALVVILLIAIFTNLFGWLYNHYLLHENRRFKNEIVKKEAQIQQLQLNCQNIFEE